MADNFLEKRYREVFGGGTRVNPETGFEEKGPEGGALAAYRKAVGNRRIPGKTETPEARGTSIVAAKGTAPQNTGNK